VADDLAAMLAFRAVPELVRLRAGLVVARGVTVVAPNAPRAAPRDALLLNAAAACWGELDGGNAPARSHPNLMAIPAALAEAEACGATVHEALVAIAVAYEVAARMGMQYPATPIAVHPHAQFAAIGAAAAIARLRRFPPARFAQALAMAATFALAGPFTHANAGASVRNAWAGVGAAAGLAACDLAQAGFTGLPDAPAKVFAGLFAGRDGSDRLAANLGRPWAVEAAYHKFTSACHYAHAAVEAAALLRAQLGGPPDPATVAAIEVAAFPLALMLDDRAPASPLAARFSVPHAVAAALVFGDCGPARCERPHLTDKRVLALRAKVRLLGLARIPPAPLDRPARVTLRLADGRTLRAECAGAKGSPAAPATAAEILAKGARLAGARLPRFSRLAAHLAAADPQLLSRKLGPALRFALKETA
jgi:2-methylcitrate dehydratase PrpD